MKSSFRIVSAGVFAVGFLGSPRALAGGLETPDNGTEALGRGGAFAAKADDPTALHHNVGGLAQQGGTRLLVNANVARGSLSFQREGSYGEGEPNAGTKYPLVENTGTPVVLPFIAATSDFGTKRATFALGTFPPHSVGGRVYPLVQNGLPGPARYDSIGGMPMLVLFHTAAMGYRITDDIDIGVAFHAVQASLGTRMNVYVDQLDLDRCKATPEIPRCDARGEAVTNGWGATGSVGSIVRLGDGMQFGLHFRGPTHLVTEGVAKLSAEKPPTPLKDTRVMVETAMPWVIRGGLRKTFGEQRAMGRDRGERGRGEPTEGTGDLELDIVYEAWGAAMDPGPRVVIEKMGPFDRQEKTVHKHYSNTVSVRLGGSYTFEGMSVPLTLRGGAFYDGSATDEAFTRLDADTLDKLALTAGASVKLGPVRLDVAYASAFDVSRTVKKGELTSADGRPAVNNGVYAGHTHIASLGAIVELDQLFGGAKLPLPKADGDRMAKR